MVWKQYIFSLFIFFSYNTTSEAYDLIVAKDGSGDVMTVQEAFDKAPQNNASRYVIYVKKGTYKEKLHLIATKSNISLIGEDKGSTILSYDDYGDKPGVGGTDYSYSTLIEGNDFYSENITYENTIDSRIAAYATGGQAVALMLKGDRTVIHNCIIRGFQDTFYTKGTGRTYVQCSQIEGTTDFIFGAGIAVFENCSIVNKKNSYTTAAANISIDTKYNYVFFNCKLIAAEGTTSAALGRPWKLYAKVVFISCEEGAHILPAGWADWSSESHSATAYFAEYKCSGPGYKPASRLSWTHQLTDTEAAEYTIPKIFAANASSPAFSSSWLPTLTGTDCGAILLDVDASNNQLQFFKFLNVKEGALRFRSNTSIPSMAVLKIFNLQGMLISEKNLELPSGEHDQLIIVDDLPEGLYMYRISTSLQVAQGKLTIEKE